MGDSMLIDGKEYKINRETAKVSEFDKIYCDLLKQILDEGEIFENRTGINTLSIEGVNFKLHAGLEFPILESKKVIMKNALSEILWIHQAQSNDVRWLEERGNNIWEEWKIDKDGIYRIYEPMPYEYEDREVDVLDLDGNVMTDKYGKSMKATSLKEGKTIKSAKYFGKKWAETIGTAYGFINNKYKKPQSVINTAKTNPNDRRMNIILWQDEYIKTGVLPPCVWGSEWKVSNGKLHAYIHQRSADTPLGLPFNVSQYAILQAMFAKVTGLEVGNLNWSIMDAHIYVNQIDGIKTQLKRYEIMKYFEEYIKERTDEEIEAYYNEHKKRYTELNICLVARPYDERLKEQVKDLKEFLDIFELMITKGTVKLELADIDDFFKFNNEVNNDKEYLQENITGNKDIKVLNYKSAPFIKMPIAQ